MYKTTLKIDGMMCGMCESHINDTIRKAVPVKKVSSSHTRGEAVVITDEPLDVEAVKAAVHATGYEVQSAVSEPYEKSDSPFRKMSAPPPYRKPRPVPMPAGRGFLCAALQTKTAMAADCHGGFVFWKAQKVATLCSAGSAGWTLTAVRMGPTPL